MTRTYVSPRRAALTRVIAGSAATILTFVIGGAGVLAVYYPLRHAGFALQWLLLFVLMVGESAGIHLPSEVILPVAGWLVVREHNLGLPGVILVSIIGALGNTVGSSLLYVAGSRGGRPLVRRFGRYVLVHEADIDSATARLGRRPGTTVIVCRLLPVVRTYVGFAAGLFGVPKPTFMLTTFAGSFVWCLAFASIGSTLGARWNALEGPTELSGIAVAVSLLIALIIASARQLRKDSSSGPKA